MACNGEPETGLRRGKRRKSKSTEGAGRVDTAVEWGWGALSLSLCVQQLPELPCPLQAPAKAAATGCVSLTPGAC